MSKTRETGPYGRRRGKNGIIRLRMMKKELAMGGENWVRQYLLRAGKKTGCDNTRLDTGQ